MSTCEYMGSSAPGWRGVASRGFFAGVLPLLFALAFIWPFSGSNATEVQMKANTSETPAAQGTVIVSMGKNENTKLDVKVKDLAPPANLKQPAEAYVVWIQPENQSAKNEGQIMVNPNRSGQLTTETPFKHFKLFITAEKSPTVTSPSGPQVLNTLIG